MGNRATSRLSRLALSAQGLTTKAPFGSGPAATKRAIEHLGYVQIDAISVINRAHFHTLWTRVPGFEEAHLEKLVRQRKVFEYWFHAASYLPFRDFRFSLLRMQAVKNGKRHWGLAEDRRLLDGVLDRIRIDGPTRARQLADKASAGKRPGWWNWGPVKRALAQLQMQGDLLVIARDGFEKTYDLLERAVPSEVDTRMPSTRELAEHLVTQSLRAHAVVSLSEIVHLRKDAELRRNAGEILREGESSGELVRIRLEGSDYFASPEALERPVRFGQRSVRLLSPFDNALIHRRRTHHIHGFDYGLECYVEPSKRQFGYFCLPILFGDRFVGRADCKAHRDSGVFEVKHLCIEHPPRKLEDFGEALTRALKAFADWHNCTEVRISRTSGARILHHLRGEQSPCNTHIPTI